jgi:curli biogenesis system outer membrane secretion channel CsgG
MNNIKTKIAMLFLFGILASLSVFAQNGQTETVNSKYQKIEVSRFETKTGLEKFTPSTLDVMMSEIADQLTKLDKFKEVTIKKAESKEAVTPGETKPIVPTDATANAEVPTKESTESTLYLSGTVTEYNEGNRTARYLIGLGAGRAKIKAHIKILDSSGILLFEKDVDGNVLMGAFGGDSGGITRGLAKEVAKVTLKKFF